ncbi:MAG: NAD-dependent epimerase/dehydratase family protein [Rubellimicrobium sp.]|nr:NAD-dependent epimerase/dehydratase family protein [Rubellimicrobium sp.]
MTAIAIIGGGGMIGRKIAHRLQHGGLAGVAALEVTLYDRVFPGVGLTGMNRQRIEFGDPAAARALAAGRPDVIFHLAAIVSGEAERDFDLGWQVNVLSFWALLMALRAEHLASGGTWRPRLVLASSAAAFGPPFAAEGIDDSFICEPRSSYGAQKVIAEHMVGDFSRKGFIDGISLRLPTITVRPGQANAALSSCFSAIIREPLRGRRAVLPLPEDTRHIHASPRAAAGFFLHAATLDTARLDGRRALNMPSVSCTVAEQIDCLRAFAGSEAVALIDHRPDPAVSGIVCNWPQRFRTARAQELGFRVEARFDDILAAYVEDDMAADRSEALP